MEAIWWLLPVSLAGLSAFALGAVLAERKLAAWIQDRMGPQETGPRGYFQTLADILKLLQKETIVPALADKGLFLLAPLIVFVAVFAGLAVVPLAPGLSGSVLQVGLLYLLAIVSIDVIGLLMAGWASHNKYALLGSVRAVAQIVSYEVPAGLALLAAVALYGTLNLDELSAMQGVYSPVPVKLLGIWEVQAYGGFLAWGAVAYPHLLVVGLIYFIAGLAEANRAPFDLAEAESELVAGFNTEYSGLPWALFFLAEYGVMLLVALLGALVFLGGWNTALPNLQALPAGVSAAELSFSELFTRLQFAYLTSGPPGTVAGTLWGLFWLLLKAFALVWVMMWVRWTLPRLRPDQLLRLCWKYLTPAALVLLVVSVVWRLGSV